MKTMPLLESDRFVIVINDILTEYKRKILTFLYMPILGPKATNLYTTFFTLIPFGQLESEPRPHGELFNFLQVKNGVDFLKHRERLEALGLLDCFVSKKEIDSVSTYLYQVKDVLTPYQFLTDPVLASLLKAKIGNEAFEKMIAEFLVHRFDINQFTKVTKSFDEVYEVVKDVDIKSYQSWWVDNQNKGVKVARQTFDYEYLVILLSALDIVDPKIIKSMELYETVKHYGFFFELTPEEMKDAIIASTRVDRTIDYQKLREEVKRVYDFKNRKMDVKPILPGKSLSTDSIIHQLESLTPVETVKQLTGTELLGSEVLIFEELVAKTGLSLGVLNTLIVYVITEKKGEIPNYNYFLKIANAWIRAGIKTTKEALDHINKEKSYYGKGQKKERSVANWFEDYLKDFNKTKETKKSEKPDENVSLEELERFFNPSPKENN